MHPDLPKLKNKFTRRGFSTAFWQFVDHEKDIEGFIAYGLYKLHKCSRIEQDKIAHRTDERLNGFRVTPDIEKLFQDKAHHFFQELNYNITDAAQKAMRQEMESNQINKLSDIIINKVRLQSAIFASWIGSFLFALTPFLLLLIVWMIQPDIRYSIESVMFKTMLALAEERSGTLVTLIDDLDEQERQRYYLTIIPRAVHEAADPMGIVGAVINGLDNLPVKDQLVRQGVEMLLAKADDRTGLVWDLWDGEIPEPAAPPLQDPAPYAPEENLDAAPNPTSPHRPMLKPATP